jgi:hypothetical protein
MHGVEGVAGLFYLFHDFKFSREMIKGKEKVGNHFTKIYLFLYPPK